MGRVSLKTTSASSDVAPTDRYSPTCYFIWPSHSVWKDRKRHTHYRDRLNLPSWWLHLFRKIEMWRNKTRYCQSINHAQTKTVYLLIWDSCSSEMGCNSDLSNLERKCVSDSRYLIVILFFNRWRDWCEDLHVFTVTSHSRRACLDRVLDHYIIPQYRHAKVRKWQIEKDKNQQITSSTRLKDKWL